MAWMVYVKGYAKNSIDDPPEGPWSGVAWQDQGDAMEEAVDAMRDASVDLAYLKEVEV